MLFGYMRKQFLFLPLLFCNRLWADPITPTITETVTYTGSGYATTGGAVSPSGFGLMAGFSGFAEVQAVPGSALSMIDIQGEFLAAGTGSATLTYEVSGGTSGESSAQFQLNDFRGGCGSELCTPGGGPNSESIELGVPFYLDLSGSASANAFGAGFQKSDYSITVQFDVYQNDNPVLITEVPLPTPEPATFYLAAVGAFGFLLAAKLYRDRAI